MIIFRRDGNDYKVSLVKEIPLGTIVHFVGGYSYFPGEEGVGGEVFKGIKTLRRAKEKAKEFHQHAGSYRKRDE